MGRGPDEAARPRRGPVGGVGAPGGPGGAGPGRAAPPPACRPRRAPGGPPMIAAHLFMLALSGILGVLAVRGLHLRRRAVRPLVVALRGSFAGGAGVTAVGPL